MNKESNKKVKNARANKFTDYPQREDIDYEMIEAVLTKQVSPSDIR